MKFRASFLPLVLGLFFAPLAARAQVKIVSVKVTATVDLNTADIDLDVTNAGTPKNLDAQWFVQHTAPDGSVDWQQINFSGLGIATGESHLHTKATLPKGSYGVGNLVWFAPGTYTPAYVANDGTTVALPATPTPDAGFAITTNHSRITKMTLSFPAPIVAPGADGKEHIPFHLEFPLTQKLMWGGVNVQAQGPLVGTSGNVQQWFYLSTPAGQWDNDFSKCQKQTIEGDTFYTFDAEIVTDLPAGTGFGNVQGQVARQDWQETYAAWVWPGRNFAVGDPVVHSDPAKRPKLTTAFAPVGTFGKAILGNLGNFRASNPGALPSNYGDVNYLIALREAFHITALRQNLDADHYVSDPVYRQLVRNDVEAALRAGLCYILAFQDEPSGNSVPERDLALLNADVQLVRDYADLADNVAFDVVNEEHLHSGWNSGPYPWKPIQANVINQMRLASPGATIFATGTNYGKDLREVEADADVLGNTLYRDGWAIHAYVDAAELAARCGTKLRVLVEEESDVRLAFRLALQALPANVWGKADWALDIAGQDSLNKVEKLSGVEVLLNADGKTLAGDNATWAKGALLSGDPAGTAGTGTAASNPVTTPPTTNPPAILPAAVTAGDVAAQIAKALSDYDAAHPLPATLATQSDIATATAPLASALVTAETALASTQSALASAQSALATVQADNAALKAQIAAVSTKQATQQAALDTHTRQLAYLKAVADVMTRRLAYLFVGVRLPAYP